MMSDGDDYDDDGMSEVGRSSLSLPLFLSVPFLNGALFRFWDRGACWVVRYECGEDDDEFFGC